MGKIPNVVHTARTRTKGGREHGISRSSDGFLDIRLAAPNSGRIGTSPEQLFAAAWSACLQHAISLAAQRRRITVSTEITIDAEVHLNVAESGQFLSADLNVTIPGVDRDLAQALVDEAHENCPYSKAIRGNIDAQIILRKPLLREQK